MIGDDSIQAVNRGGTWNATVEHCDTGDMRGNALLIDLVRKDIIQRLAEHPEAERVERRLSPFLRVTAVRTTPVIAPLTVMLREPSGVIPPRGPLQGTGTAGTSDDKESDATIQTIVLPNAELTGRAACLVGLEPLIADMSLDLKLRLQGGLDAWARASKTPVPEPLRAHLEDSGAVLLATGPPGTGKTSALLQVANRFSIEAGISGIVLIADTKLRGPHVGESSERLRRFANAARNQPYGFRALLFDEVEAVASNRSMVGSHIEDKSLTVSVLSLLDSLATDPMTCVLMASNCADMIDPAVRRRATEYIFERPDRAVRQALIQQWFPNASPRECIRLVGASDGMTPAGIHRALSGYYRSLILSGQRPDLRNVAVRLRRTPRTKDV